MGQYANLFEDDDRTRASLALRFGIEAKPDDAARDNVLARRFGLPPAVVQQYRPDYEARAAVEDAQPVLQRAPVLRSWIAADMERAKVAHDDLGPLSSIEGAIRYLVSAPGAARGGLIRDVGRAASTLYSGVVGLNANLYAAAAAPFGVADQVAQSLDDLAAAVTGTSRRQIVGTPGVESFLLNEQAAAKRVAKGYAVDTTGMSPEARGFWSGLQSAGQNLAAMPLGFINPALMLGTMGASSGGEAYGKGREAGLSPAQSAVYGAQDAAAEIVTEKYLGAAGLLKNIKAGASAGKLMAYELLREVPGEVGATLWQNFNEWMHIHPEKSMADFVMEQPDAIRETIVATLVGGGVQVGTVKGIERAMGVGQQRDQQAQQADRHAQALTELATLAEASRLRERDPESFATFAQSVADEGLPNLYLDAQVLQKSGVDLAMVAQALPSVAAQVQQALATGGDLVVPTSEFLTLAPGQAFVPALVEHARTAPEAMSAAEAKTWMAERGDALQAEIGRVLEEQQGNQAFEASRAQLQADFEAQFKEAGRFDAKVGSSYSTLLASFYAVQAAKLGKLPGELAQQYPLRISAAAGPGSVVMEQRPHAEITGEEFGSPDLPVAELRKVAKSWYDSTLRGTSVVNAASGKKVQFAGSRKAFNSNADPGKVRLFAALPELIANGQIVESKPTQDQSAEPSTKAYHWLVGDVQIGGRAVRAGVTLREDAAGNLYYNHNPINERAQNSQTRSGPAHKAGAGESENGALQQTVAAAAAADDLNLAILNKDGATGPRGQIAFAQDITTAPSVVTLFNGADLSTFIHEAGHFFLQMQADLAARIQAQIDAGSGVTDAERGLVDDMNRLLAWFGVQGSPEQSALTAWQLMTPEEQRQYHEQFARGFELYAFEGKSPSLALQGLFQRFRAWLVSVYRAVTNSAAAQTLQVQLTDEVRGVMDRMIASTEEIKVAEAARAMGPLFGTAEAAGMTPEEFAAYHAQGVAATAEAIDRLQERSLRDMKWLANARARRLKEAQERVAGLRREVEREVRAEVMSQPLYRAWTFLTAKMERSDMLPIDEEKAAQRDAVRAWQAERLAAEKDARAAEEQAVWEASPESQKKRRTQRSADAAHRSVLRAARDGIERAVVEKMQAWEAEHPKPAGAGSKANGRALDVTRDSLLVAIAKLGGINSDSARRDLGVADDATHTRVAVFGAANVFRKTGGMTAERALEALTEAGYMHDLDEFGRSDLRALEDAIGAELSGDPQHSQWFDYGAAQAEEAKRQVANPQALQAGRLDLTNLRALGLSDEALAKLQARKMTARDGLHPDVVAELFGFSSGDELARALADAPPPREVVQQRTDQTMLERFGDLATPEGVQRAADEAIHSEARGRFIAAEFDALQHAMRAPGAAGQRTASALATAARQYALATVARMRVRDLRPGDHAAAAARAARAAEKAHRAGDLQAAAESKRNQLIQHEAERAATSAQHEAERALAYFRRFDKRGKRLDPDYAEQIEALLERFDLRPASNKTLDRRRSLAEWAQAQEEQGLVPEIDPALLNEARRQHWRELTMEELRGLRDSVQQIEHMGRLKNRLLTSKAARDFAAVRDELVATIEDNAGEKLALSRTRTPSTTLGRTLAALRNFGAKHIKVATWARIMDGGQDGGPVWEYLVRTANERGDFETSRRAEATEALYQIMKPVLAGGNMGGKGRHFPSIDRSMNREQVFAMALNMGNAANIQRMLGGEGWTMAQIQPGLATLTAADWQAAQAVWDHFETYRPEIGAKERRVYGKEPAWVEPQPLTVATADGQTVTLRGGYYPIKYDPIATARAEQHDDAEAAKRQLKGAYTSATTRRGFTKDRAAEVKGRPLLYSLAGVYSGVNDVIHDLAWHEWLIDANKILRSDLVDAAIRQHYGPEVVRQFKTWVEDIATGERGHQGQLDSALGRLRQGVSVAGLGFNVMSAAMQPLGLTQSIVRVGAQWVGRGIASYIANPLAATRDANERSDFMANRSRTRFRELNELRNQVEGQTAAGRALTTGAYWLMMRCQQLVDVPTWHGAYQKAVAEGNDEERAVALADQAVIDAQGGGQTKDLAAIERGGSAQKLFTVFYSFMNTAANLGVAQTAAADTPAKKAKLAADYLLLFTVPAVLGAILRDALTPGDAGDDDPDKLAKKLLAAQLDYLMGMMVLVRETTEAVKIAAGLSDHQRDYAGPAGLRVFPDAVSFAKQAAQGELDDPFRKAAVNLIGSLFGLPAAQANRTITGAQALQEGKTDNPAALAFGFQEPR